MRHRLVPALAVALLAGAPSVFAQPQKTPPPAKPATGTITGAVRITDPGGKAVAANAVVYVIGKSDQPTDNGPPQEHQIIQKDKKFWPDLIAITKGDSVIFPNQDKVLHNVFSPKPQFDLGTLKHGEGKKKPKQFTATGVVDVYCNIHPAMAATVLVLPNRYHVNTNGRFTLTGVPEGEWTLFAYTRRAQKPRSVKVRVAAGQVTNVGTIQIVRGPEAPHPNKWGGKYGPSYP